jgi:hypothetical protein
MHNPCPVTTQRFQKLTKQQLVAKIVALEDICFNLHMDVECTKMSPATKQALDAVVTQLHSTLYA